MVQIDNVRSRRPSRRVGIKDGVWVTIRMAGLQALAHKALGVSSSY